MQNQNNKLFFPFFYKYATLISEILSREEVGTLVYAIIENRGTFPPKEPLDSKICSIYELMVSDANRIFEKNLPKSGKVESAAPKQIRRAEAAPTHERYGNFDPNEAFQEALRRSYPDIK